MEDDKGELHEVTVAKKEGEKAAENGEAESSVTAVADSQQSSSAEGSPAAAAPSTNVVEEVKKVEKEFTLTNLEAVDLANTSRTAKAGETLYYVDAPTLKSEKRNTQFEITIDPKLPADEVEKERIQWTYNTTHLADDDGKIKVEKSVAENDNAEVSVQAGVPNADEKKVNVEWVKENRSSSSYAPPFLNKINQVLTRSIATPLTGATKGINAFIPQCKFDASVEPISINAEISNEEDENTRHYFKVLETTYNGGISLNGECVGYPPFLKPLNISGISTVGLYIKSDIGVSFSGGELKKKNGETDKEVVNNNILEGAIRGCIEAGLKTELFVLQEHVEFDVRGFGRGCASGKVRYNFTTENFTGGLYLEPVNLGVKAKIASKGFIDFELVNIEKTWSITKEIPLYKFGN